MFLTARSLPGTGILRPQPNVFESEDKKTLVIVTNWGTQSVAPLIFEKVKSFMAPEFFDPDATQFKVTPEKIEKPIEVKLSEALHAANEEIYKTENEKKWRTVLEVTALHADAGTLYWAQSGLPHILISSPEEEISSELVSVVADPSAIYNVPVPLPTSGLGLDQFPNINSGFMQVKVGTLLALLSMPVKALPMMTQSGFSVEQLSQMFSSVFPNQPAWIGIVQIKK